jgi:hypothetical protein
MAVTIQENKMVVRGVRDRTVALLFNTFATNGYEG